MRKIICKKVAFVMAIALMATNIIIFPSDVQAAESYGKPDAGQTVIYQPYDDVNDVEAYMAAKAAPTYIAKEGTNITDSYGYLFGGWFTEVTVEGVTKYKPIKSLEELNEAETNNTGYFAKFVPAYILSVKCQNDFGTVGDTPQTEMRIVAGVDSTNYARVGFEIKAATFETNGDLKQVGTKAIIGESKNDNNEKILWEKLVVYSDEDTYNKHTPKSVLGEAGKYFMGYRLSVSKKNYAGTFVIRPFWETYDGVVVYGLTKYAHIEDGINGYINIPVNLKNENKVAAGVVEFDWSVLKSAGYEYMSAECGKSFKTQKVNSDVTDGDKSIIRCLVMSDITSDNQGVDVDSDDIYINLRFKKGEAAIPKAFDGTFYHFAVNKEDFSDMSENVYQESISDSDVNKNIITLYDVWNIQY